MKTHLKKLTAFVCITAMLLFQTSVLATESVRLYEQYRYQENFEYSDEIIAHALKSAVPKIMLGYEATITYEPVFFDTDELVNVYVNTYNAHSDEYTEEEIAGAVLNDVQENLENYLAYDEEKTVTVNGIYTGSGVVISDDGYVATNAHVATLDDGAKLELYLSGLNENVVGDLSGIITELSDVGLTFTEEQIAEVYDVVIQDAATRAEVIDEYIQLEVWFPDALGNTDADSAIKYEATLVEEGVSAASEDIEGYTQDTAILKIDAENLISLKISDSYPALNSKIVTAGFPAASAMIFQAAGSNESVMSITVGTGQVAQLVPIKGSEYKAIGITTTISGGNSGGPSVDSNLNIEGLNTYHLAADARYAYMVPAEYVSYLAQGYGMGQGETSKTFLLGLQMLQQNYGTTALKCFEKVKRLQPDTPYIEELIQLANDAPDKEAPRRKGSLGSGTNLMIILVIVLVVVVVIIAANNSKGKKKPPRSGSGTSTSSAQGWSPGPRGY
ncbi:MAG: trypsin-like peptidase domain-containing protein [Clostridia bacterium]|nr:trypsin-like peptidase domain-containing protein [Clostridia bacterium]